MICRKCGRKFTCRGDTKGCVFQEHLSREGSRDDTCLCAKCYLLDRWTYLHNVLYASDKHMRDILEILNKRRSRIGCQYLSEEELEKELVIMSL